MGTKLKEAFQNYLKYSFNSILNISHRSRFRALDPNLAKTGSATLSVWQLVKPHLLFLYCSFKNDVLSSVS